MTLASSLGHKLQFWDSKPSITGFPRVIVNTTTCVNGYPKVIDQY